jgi:hypothetical protein
MSYLGYGSNSRLENFFAHFFGGRHPRTLPFARGCVLRFRFSIVLVEHQLQKTSHMRYIVYIHMPPSCLNTRQQDGHPSSRLLLRLLRRRPPARNATTATTAAATAAATGPRQQPLRVAPDRRPQLVHVAS